MAELLLRGVLSVTPWATAAVLLLLALRRPLARWVPARAFRLAWLLLALRLALPFDLSLPHAPLAAPLPAPLAQAVAPQAAALPGDVAIGPAVPFTPAQGGSSPAALLPWLWLAGVAVFLLAHLGVYGHFRWALCRSRARITDEAVQGQAREDFGRDMPAYTVPGLAGPMLVGFVHPALYLPEDLPGETLPYVFAHEARHRRAGDVQLLFLLLAAGACQWFNPAIYAMTRMARRDMELACDEAVLAGRPLAYRRAYGAAVLDTVRRGHKKSVLATGFSGAGRHLKRRFSAMFDTSHKKGGAFLLGALAAVVLLASTLVACSSQAAQGSSSAPAAPSSSSGVAASSSSAGAASAPESEAAMSSAASSATSVPDGGTEPVPAEGAQTVFPVPGYTDAVSGDFGTNGHRGTDIAAPQGTPVCAMAAGEATEAGFDEAYGNYVKVQCGSDTWYLYAHCDSLAVEKGMIVEAGQLLAYVGNTGNSTGNHVHVELSVGGVLQDPVTLWMTDAQAAAQAGGELLKTSNT